MRCGKVFENKQYLDLHIGRKHKQNFTCSGRVVEHGKEYECSFVTTDRNHMWTHFRTLHLNIWCNYCVIPTCSFGRDELSAVLKHQHDKHGMNTGLMCMRCNKVFSQSGKLKDHHLTCNNKERPFICEQCGRDFRQRTELNIHLKQVHPKVPGDRSGSVYVVWFKEIDFGKSIMSRLLCRFSFQWTTDCGPFGS